jgi:hypothetical protein
MHACSAGGSGSDVRGVLLILPLIRIVDTMIKTDD